VAYPLPSLDEIQARATTLTLWLARVVMPSPSLGKGLHDLADLGLEKNKIKEKWKK